MAWVVEGSTSTIQRLKLWRKHWNVVLYTSFYCTLHKNWVHTWKTKYVQELAKGQWEKNTTTEIKEFPSKKSWLSSNARSWAGLIGWNIFTELRPYGGVVYNATTMAASEGIVHSSDSKLLAKMVTALKLASIGKSCSWFVWGSSKDRLLQKQNCL